jgi:hypothetical protein
MAPEVPLPMTDHAGPAAGHDPAGTHDSAHTDPDASGGHGAHAAGHDEMILGPTDWTAWGIGLVAVLAGVIVALCAAISTGAITV